MNHNSSANGTDIPSRNATDTIPGPPVDQPGHGGGSSNLLMGFLLVTVTAVVLCGLVVFYIQRKKRERLRLAFKPIYNTEGDDDWDINVDPTVQVKDTTRLTPTKQQQKIGPAFSSDLSNSNYQQQQASRSKSIGKGGGGAAQINNNRATLQFNLNGADTEDVPHPEVTHPPPTKFTTT